MDVTLEQANKAIEAAIARCRSMGLRMSFAVVDTKRDLVATARMDGAMPFTPDVARGKAMVSVLFGTPSRDQTERGARQVFQVVNRHYADKLVFAPGAVLLKVNSETIGALGASGATPDEDEEVATAGGAALA